MPNTPHSEPTTPVNDMTEPITQDYDPAVPVDTLTEHPDNARRGDVEAIDGSMRQHGFYGAIYAQRGTGRIIAGNHRHRVAVARGVAEVPVIWLDVDDDQARRIMLHDNRTSDLAGYDDDRLAALLADMHSDSELGLVGTGYTVEDLAELAGDDLLEPGPDLGGDPDEVPAEPPVPVTKPGDVWLLGPHRVLCGDSRRPEDVALVLDGQTFNLAFTSPPYADRREYDETSGFRPIPPDEYVGWFDAVQANVAEHLAPDGSWFVNIKPGTENGRRELYVFDLVIAHVRRWGWGLVDEFAWTHAGLPGRYVGRFKNAWEPLFHFAKAPTSEIKYRPQQVAIESDDAFTYDRAATRTATGNIGFRDHETSSGLALPSNVVHFVNGRHVGDHAGTIAHEAAFTVRLPEWFTKAFTDPGDLVYDPFLGSGSTLIAADRQDRVCAGVELSPRYVDTVCRRWQQITGDQPVLERTGDRHDFTADTEAA